MRPGRARVRAPGELLEEIVERPDRAAEESRPQLEQIALDAIDVRAVRDDENRLPDAFFERGAHR